MMQEIHDSSFKSHVDGRTLDQKVLLAGYFQLTLEQDAAHLIATYLSYQRHQQLSRHSTEFLKVVIASCPFNHWGLYIVIPFLARSNQKKFLIVAMDYFSNYIKAEPLARITEEEVLKFFWKNTICRYRIPQRLVSYNGRQFQGCRLQKWCQEFGIQ